MLQKRVRFHMESSNCSIWLQRVVYQFGLPYVFIIKQRFNPVALKLGKRSLYVSVIN